MSQQQEFVEALIKLCVLLYQADGKITLTEQDYLEEITAKVRWRGEMEIEDFLSQTIHEVREVIDGNREKDYVNSLQQALSLDANRALNEAIGIALADGSIVEVEQEILDHLSHKVLAKALRKQIESEAV